MPARPAPFSLPKPEEQTALQGVAIKMPKPLHKRLKAICEENDVSMQDTINKMVEHCLDELDEANAS